MAKKTDIRSAMTSLTPRQRPHLSSPQRGGQRAPASLPLRFALRELRGGLRGFYVFVACIALGVMAIAGVNSVASGLAEGLAREGRVILGGDLRFRSACARQARRNAHSSSAMAASRSPPRCGRWPAAPDGRTALVEVKAVDSAYPLYGAVTLDPASRCRCARRARRRVRRRCRSALLARLDLKPGARIMVGSPPSRFAPRSRPSLTSFAGGIGFGPRLLMSEAALRATGLLQPGSVVRWHYRCGSRQ